MNLITRSASRLYRSRLRTVESYGSCAVDIQQVQLKKLLKRAEKTVWGKEYGYGSIHDYATYVQRVPLQTYDTLKSLIRRMIDGEKDVLWPAAVKWYARSSGTTNDRSKFIPVTPEIMRSSHFQGGYDTTGLYLRNHPESRFFAGKGLILGGSHSLFPLNRKAHCGDLSALLIRNLPSWVNLVRIPKKRIILMDEWESKIRAIVAHTWNRDVGSLSGIPSWMLALIREVLKKAGRETLTEVWPNLEVFFHGGVSFEPYRTQYESLIPSDRMHYMETYNASEGFFGIQDDPADSSLLLMLDYGIFYEFIPMTESGKESSVALPLEEVRTGVNYALVISTAGGLWRYRIGDTVRFTSLFPHKFVISGRTQHYINAFGEELMVDNAEKGIQMACRQTGAEVNGYTAAPLFLLDRAKGRHQWLIEFEKPPASIEAFAAALDHALQTLNSDYEAKRYREISLQPPEVIPARKHLFHRWLKMKGKLGGQHKVPRLSNRRAILDELLALNQTPEGYAEKND
ncbi:MAG: GH3 auxin-responsive promoter family protein [Tannerella sp.]|nr:GH3 auxin-responsive promoter family protein [Tannerella sp.]